MSRIKYSRSLAAGLFALMLFTGCESTDGGSSRVSVGGYYGGGFYDPWYYGDYNHDHDIVVTPPVNRPDWGTHPGARPEQPIARPPDVSSRPPAATPKPAARPMPSIPSTPRPAPAFRGGGGGGGGGRR